MNPKPKFKAQFYVEKGNMHRPVTVLEKANAKVSFLIVNNLTNEIIKKEQELAFILDGCTHNVCYTDEETDALLCSVCGRSL